MEPTIYKPSIYNGAGIYKLGGGGGGGGGGVACIRCNKNPLSNNYKFSALPSGRREYDDGTFYDGFFQCASITEADLDNCESLFIQNDENVFDNYAYKLDGISIRLIKD